MRPSQESAGHLSNPQPQWSRHSPDSRPPVNDHFQQFASTCLTLALTLTLTVSFIFPLVLSTESYAREGTSTNSSIDIQQERVVEIFDSAREIANHAVLSPSESRFFEATAASTLFKFINPDSVLDLSTRNQLHDKTIQILESDLAKVTSGGEGAIDASPQEISATLAYTRIKYSTMGETASQERLDSFIQSIEKDAQPIRNEKLSLHQASQLIRSWGIDPFDITARPYYCALGITGLSVMDVHQITFCH